jgi:hypothetical protein
MVTMLDANLDSNKSQLNRSYGFGTKCQIQAATKTATAGGQKKCTFGDGREPRAAEEEPEQLRCRVEPHKAEGTALARERGAEGRDDGNRPQIILRRAVAFSDFLFADS